MHEFVPGPSRRLRWSLMSAFGRHCLRPAPSGSVENDPLLTYDTVVVARAISNIGLRGILDEQHLLSPVSAMISMSVRDNRGVHVFEY